MSGGPISPQTPMPKICGSSLGDKNWSYTMKMISAVFLALAFLSMAAPVNAFDARSFFEQQSREGGH